MPSRLRSVLTPVALVSCLLLGGTAAAMPVVQGPAGAVAVNDTVVFTLSDDTPTDGFNTAADVYLSDFSFSYDAGALRYVQSDAVLAGSTLFGNPVLPGDPDPAGTFGAQFIGPSSITPAAGATLFTVTFQALTATGAGGTSLNLSSPPFGAYGDAVSGGVGDPSAFAPTTGSVVISSVPEPDAWAMLLLGGALVAGLGRSRARRA